MIAVGSGAAAGWACGGDGGRSAESYYAELEPIMRASHDDLAAQRATWEGMDDARLSAAYAAYQTALDEFAVGLDEVVPADEVEAAHDAMTVATRAIADIYADRARALAGTGGTAGPTTDLDDREQRLADEWFRACHDLQDRALVEEIDVDLLCVTMLGSNTESRP